MPHEYDAVAPWMIENPAGHLAVLLAVLALIFWSAEHRVLGRVFRVIPALTFCYFVPMTLTALGVLPAQSPVYSWVKDFVLPACLVLMTLALDLKELARLGPKALLTFLAGTAGVIIGGPIALLIWKRWLPDDAWQGMAALAGTWIGGGANMIAMKESVGASDSIMGPIIVVDTGVGGIWMGILMYLAARHEVFDRRRRADNSAIRHLERKMEAFQAKVARIPTLTDLLVLLALAFGAAWLCFEAGAHIDAALRPHLSRTLQDILSETTWKILLVTAVGIALSLTPMRNYEGAGASRVGSVMIYLLVACIGATADLHAIIRAPAFLAMGLTWMAVHAVILFLVGHFLRAPLFFIAVGSQANIGGAASAPAVASVFHPALAPVGALMAIAGYILGTYGAIVCAWLLRHVA